MGKNFKELEKLVEEHGSQITDLQKQIKTLETEIQRLKPAPERSVEIIAGKLLGGEK